MRIIQHPSTPVIGGRAGCAHHWILGLDDQPATVGTCRNCGAERLFHNHLPGDRYEREWRASRLVEPILIGASARGGRDDD